MESSSNSSGNGGAGLANNITGTTLYYGAGGGGGVDGGQIAPNTWAPGAQGGVAVLVVMVLITMAQHGLHQPQDLLIQVAEVEVITGVVLHKTLIRWQVAQGL
jgi:hypothetical protein